MLSRRQSTLMTLLVVVFSSFMTGKTHAKERRLRGVLLEKRLNENQILQLDLNETASQNDLSRENQVSPSARALTIDESNHMPHDTRGSVVLTIGGGTTGFLGAVVTGGLYRHYRRNLGTENTFVLSEHGRVLGLSFFGSLIGFGCFGWGVFSLAQF